MNMSLPASPTRGSVFRGNLEYPVRVPLLWERMHVTVFVRLIVSRQDVTLRHTCIEGAVASWRARLAYFENQ